MLIANSKLTFLSLLNPATKPRIWLYLAYTAIVNEYRRTMIGPFWILLNLVFFSLSVGVVYSGLFSIEYFEYVVYMATGMIGWLWASAILINGGMVYISNSGLLLDHPTDKAYLIWSYAAGQFLIFLHQLPFIALFYLLGYIPLSVNLLYILPSVLIVFTINIGAASVLSILVTRYRDFHKILSSLTIIIMISTPIFWKPQMVDGVRQLVYLLNPFYYIVEILRDPLLGKAPALFEYGVAAVIAATLLLLGCYMHKKYSNVIIFRL